MPLTPANPTMLGAVANTGAPTVGSPVTLASVATVLKKTAVKDGYGSSSETWADGATVPCRLIRTTNPQERSKSGALQASGDWTCLLPLGTIVLTSNRLRIDGTIYEVTETDAGLTGAVELTATLRKINQ